MAGLFAVGSACFFLGALPVYFDAVSPRRDSMTYFVGSIFFTTAASIAYVGSAAGAATSGESGVVPGWLLERGVAPHRLDWWSSAVQLVGTVAFNVTTLLGVRAAWQPVFADVLVWSPDAVGSVCFLVSSSLAVVVVRRGRGRVRPGDVSWWVAAANLAGSVFFGLSALGAVVVGSGDALAPGVVNAGTALGGLCFFVGAVLLIPEARRVGSAQSVNEPMG
jgi:hypothetical protein